MQSRQRDRVAPLCFDALARPLRDQGRSDHGAIVAERLDLAVKPLPRRPGFKTDMERSRRAANLLIIRSTGSGALSTSLGHPDFAAPATYRAVLLLATSEATKNFAMLSHSPRSVHEARLDSPEQPSFLTARKGGPPARAREHDV